MKSTIQFFNALGMEGTILLMLAVVTIGSLAVNIAGLNHPSGTGVHIGSDVEDAGTNPWQ